MSIELLPRRICTPAMVYLILAVIQVIAGLAFGTVHIFTVGMAILLVGMFLWTWLLDFICKAGYTLLSWVLVILPILISTLLIVVLAKYFLSLSPEEQQKIQKELKEAK